MEKHEQHEHKKEHEHTGEPTAKHAKQMDTKTVVMMVMVGLLILVSAIQAVELTGLKEKLSDGSLAVSSASAKTTVGAGSGSEPSPLSKNLDSLPSMVGGC